MTPCEARFAEGESGRLASGASEGDEVSTWVRTKSPSSIRGTRIALGDLVARERCFHALFDDARGVGDWNELGLLGIRLAARLQLDVAVRE